MPLKAFLVGSFFYNLKEENCSLLLTAACAAVGIATSAPNRSPDLCFSLECLLLTAAVYIYAKIRFTNQQFSASFKVVGKLTLQRDDNLYCCIKVPCLT